MRLRLLKSRIGQCLTAREVCRTQDGGLLRISCAQVLLVMPNNTINAHLRTEKWLPNP